MSPAPVPAVRLPARSPAPSRATGSARSGAARPLPLPGGARRPAALRPNARRPGAPGAEAGSTRLRLVDNSLLEVAARHRRVRRLLVVAAVLVVAALLALAGVNAVLVSNQVRLDELEQQVVDAQARHQALRLEVATLEAPERVVSAATERLGMVSPETITYVEPAPERAPASAPGSVGRSGEDAVEEPSEGSSSAWGAVKPYLSR